MLRCLIILLLTTFTVFAPPNLAFQKRKNASAGGMPLASGLEAYWKMNEAENVGLSIQNNLADSTGHNHTMGINPAGGLIYGQNGTGTPSDGGLIHWVGSGNGSTNADAAFSIGSGKSFTLAIWGQFNGGDGFVVGKWNNGDTTKDDYMLWSPHVAGPPFVWSVYNLANARVDLTNYATTSNPSGVIGMHLVSVGYDDSLQEIWFQLDNGPRLATNCVGVRATSVPFSFTQPSGSAMNSPFSAAQSSTMFWTRSLSLQDTANLYNLGSGVTFSVLNAGSYTVQSPNVLVDETNIVSWVANAMSEFTGNFVTTNAVTALHKFYSNLKAAGILGKFYAIHTMQTFSADNDSALARYPTFRKGGIVNWGPTGGFAPVPRSINVNGIAWDGNGGVSELYVTDFTPSTGFPSQTSNGMSVYVYTNHGDQFDCAANNGGTPSTMIAVNVGGAYQFQNGSSTANNITASVSTPPPLGFYSDNRVSSTDHRVYFANSGTAFGQYGATDTTSFSSTLNTSPVRVFFDWVTGGQGSERLSYFSIHDGWSSVQANTEYTNVQQLRVDLGGGYR